MSRELLQRALDALELINHRGNTDDELLQAGNVMIEIRAELAKPENPLQAFHDFFANRGEKLFCHFGQDAIDLWNAAWSQENETLNAVRCDDE